VAPANRTSFYKENKSVVDQLDSQISKQHFPHMLQKQECIKYHELAATKSSNVFNKKPTMGLTAHMIKCMRSSADYDATFAASLCSQPEFYLNYLPSLFCSANLSSYNFGSTQPINQYNCYDRLSRSQFSTPQQPLAAPNNTAMNHQARGTMSTCRFTLYNSSQRNATTTCKIKQTNSPQYDSIIDTVF
jgi:hypothetical protein